MTDPTKRFTDRVDSYRRFRPGYPKALIERLAEVVAPSGEKCVADVGSGTGILTAMLLEAGYTVIAVEPNGPMRAVAESDLSRHRSFRSLAGSAEATGIASGTVDLVTAAQAFHWFDPVRARAEFRRIVKADGFVALIWNERDKTESVFAREYEELLLQYGTDYKEVDHSRTGMEKARVFWQGAEVTLSVYPNAQLLDRTALHGRVDSSSYVPHAGEKGHVELHAELDGLFDRHQRDGVVPFVYRCELHLGRLVTA